MKRNVVVGGLCWAVGVAASGAWGQSHPSQVFSVLPTGQEAALFGRGLMGGPSVLPAASPASVPGPRPTAGSVVVVDVAGLNAVLAAVPQERVIGGPGVGLRGYGMVMALLHPSGGVVNCFVAESAVMEAPLAARYPGIRTFIVQSADGTAAGRMELSPRGLTAMLRTADGVWMIDPWRSADPAHVVAYWLADLPGGDDWRCDTVADARGVEAVPEEGGHTRGGPLQERRNVRMAMACTGEYGLHQCDIQGHAPNIADPLAAIVTVVSRANVVYESDLGVHFNLVANDDLLIFIDPDTDPYPSSCGGGGGSDCSGDVLAVNVTLVPSIIGDANFDVGHVVTRIFGGVAYLRAVCQSFKAGGVSGIPRGGDVDPFTALVVIHEVGHQFGANHTFSGSRGRCAGNVHLSTAWEAGSGSSPMAYAGGCPVGDAPPSDNVAQFADPFFHHGSLLEMRGFLASGEPACLTPITTTNSIPTITSVTPASAIPPGTPFVLTAAATDADQDPLTYSWEQYDAGTARPLSGDGSADDGTGALFRVFPPVPAGTRTFPKMADVLAGVPTPGEQLPGVAAVRHFRVAVRDNHPTAGGVAISSLVNVTIPSGASPFGVVAPAESAAMRTGAGHPGAVMWSVGGTTAAPISCSSVTIRLSTDDGATFPVVLGSVPNSGSANVVCPARSSPAVTTARVQISGNGKIFFTVSRPFTLLPCSADVTGDGAVNVQDFLAYLSLYSAGAAAAEFTGDGAVNVQDFLAFLTAYASGC
jgi:hypothetical protein